MKMKRKKRNLISDCKGFALMQMIMVLIFLVVLAISSLFVYKAFNEINTDLQADLDLSTQSKAVVDDLHTRYPSTMDNVFITVLSLLFILAIVASYFTDENPFWIIVIIFLLIVSMLLAGIFSNVWEEITDDAEITFETSFPMTNYLLDNYMIVFAVVGMVIGLTIYLKNRI